MVLDQETLTLLLDAVRRFVTERLVPAEEALAQTGWIPDDIVREMREPGLFSLSISPEHGGLGLTMEKEVKVVFKLGQTSPAFRSLAGTNIGIGSQSTVLTGSDAMVLRTTAARDGDHYILNSTKRYITNALIVGLFSVMARTALERHVDSISCFLVEAGTPGMMLGKPDKKMGQAGVLTCDVVFDNCRAPATVQLGGQEGMGSAPPCACWTGRLRIAALCVGIAEFQLVQAMLADSRPNSTRRAAWCWTLPPGATGARTRPWRLLAPRCSLLEAGYRSDAFVDGVFRQGVRTRANRNYEEGRMQEQTIQPAMNAGLYNGNRGRNPNWVKPRTGAEKWVQ